MQTKAALRKQLRGKLQRLSPAEVERTSRTVCREAFDLIDWSAVQTVLSYVPLAGANEIDPYYLTKLLSHAHIDYAASAKDASLPVKKYDVIIVPVLGFRSDGYRLGRGGGWYDRLLAIHPNSVSIGLAYAWSEVDFAPEAHDEPLRYICRA